MVLKIGHRGAAGRAPENTLQSFEKAVILGCDITELDVHLCGSNEVVVIHDETVDRTTNGTGFVSKLSLKNIKELDAGNGEKIPKLDEVLNFLKDNIMLNIELKGPGTEKPVYDLIGSCGWKKEEIIITSFNWDMLCKYRKIDKDALIGPLTFRDHVNALNLAVELDAYCINPYYPLLNRKYVKEVQNQGIKVFPWTVNKKQHIENLIELGVDGIISDYPDIIK